MKFGLFGSPEEKQLREKLRKIQALFDGATTEGERQAAAAALARVREALASASARPEPPPETQFTVTDQWQRRLLYALCRKYGIEPYRYKRQRRTTVIIRAPRDFVDRTLWPEYLELERALHAYLEQATERIIREEVYRDVSDPLERLRKRWWPGGR